MALGAWAGKAASPAAIAGRRKPGDAAGAGLAAADACLSQNGP